MSIKLLKPNTAGRRHMSVTDYSCLTKKKPEKSLTYNIGRSAGRDKTGQISVRHRGGGAKRKYREIMTLNQKLGLKAKVVALEYDPNRSAFIALVNFEDDIKAYVLAWHKIKIDDEVVGDLKAEVKLGNRMILKNIPTGTQIHDLEFHQNHGGKLVKSAGSSAMILAKDEGWCQVKMPSGEIRWISENSFASIGQVSNITHSAQTIGSAGRRRHMGIRPSVRGKAMNPNSHPHGGGEGQNSIGLKYPKTPWGKHALGTRTRKKNKYSATFIVKRRKK